MWTAFPPSEYYDLAAPDRGIGHLPADPSEEGSHVGFRRCTRGNLPTDLGSLPAP
jgi:hypothetical protein